MNLNSFQLLLIQRTDTLAAGDFDVEMNYDTITWEAGTASGSNDEGKGGSPARVGYSNGTMGESRVFYELPGSGISGALLDNGPNALISHSLNSSVPG